MHQAARLGALAIVVGCSPADPVPDAAPDAPAEMHATWPRVVDLGGGVIAAPKIQPIFFAGDALQPRLEEFFGQLASSPYWTATTSEYGVGTATVLASIVSHDPPPSTLDALQAWLVAHVPGDASTIYAPMLPAGTVLQTPNGDACLLGSAHDEVTGTNGQPIIHTIVPHCAQPNELDWATTSLAHELVEAATDPRVRTGPAFGDIDADHYVVRETIGNEVTDLCETLSSAYQPLVGDFVVPRSWSNAAAIAGHDPCVPSTATYVAAAPTSLAEVPIEAPSGRVTTRGLVIPVGTAKTIEIALVGEPSADEVVVTARDFASYYRGGEPELAFQWGISHGRAGDMLHVRIEHLRAGPMLGSAFELTTLSGYTEIASWIGFVAN